MQLHEVLKILEAATKLEDGGKELTFFDAQLVDKIQAIDMPEFNR